MSWRPPAPVSSLAGRMAHRGRVSRRDAGRRRAGRAASSGRRAAPASPGPSRAGRVDRRRCPPTRCRCRRCVLGGTWTSVGPLARSTGLGWTRHRADSGRVRAARPAEIRSYELSGTRFILVFEPFERSGEPRVAASTSVASTIVDAGSSLRDVGERAASLLMSTLRSGPVSGTRMSITRSVTGTTTFTSRAVGVLQRHGDRDVEELADLLDVEHDVLARRRSTR